MMEEDARAKIRTALDRLQATQGLGKESKAEDDTDSVEYHIEGILKAGGGIWNEMIAKDYIQNLEAQVGQEIEASDPLS